jgi:hypothetical protein
MPAATMSRTPRRRRRKSTRDRPRLLDFEGHEISVGDVVQVVEVDWSIGTASWMRDTPAIVTAIGRQRIAVQFERKPRRHFLSSRSVRIAVS